MFEGLEWLQNLIGWVLAVIGFYVVFLWFCLVFWTFRDIQARTRDILLQVLATLLVLLFNLPGLLLYIVLRPPETLAEAYARSLQEESLMRDIEERHACPQCKRRTEPDFLFCPVCRTELKQLCVHCQRVLQPGWQLCPYCGQERERTAEARPLGPRAGEKGAMAPEERLSQQEATQGALVLNPGKGDNLVADSEHRLARGNDGLLVAHDE